MAGERAEVIASAGSSLQLFHPWQQLLHFQVLVGDDFFQLVHSVSVEFGYDLSPFLEPESLNLKPEICMTDWNQCYAESLHTLGQGPAFTAAGAICSLSIR